MLRRSKPGLRAVALFVLLGPATAAAQSETVDLDRLLAQALELHRDGDMLGAIDSYRSILERDPDRVDARSNLGAAYVHMGRHDEAIEQYRLALARQPKNSDILFNLGLALYKAGRLTEAAAELASVVALQPEHNNAILLLAECHLQTDAASEAVELLSPLEETFGADRTYAYLLGTALLREGDVERGQVLMERVLSAGDSAETRVLMGTAYLEAEDYARAVEEFGRAAEMNPELARVHSLHGQALLGTRDLDAAEAAFRRAVERDPNDFQANLHLGSLKKEVGRYPEALAYLTRASRLRSHDPTVLFTLGSLYLETGENEAALAALSEVVEAAPDFLEGHALLATAYYRLKRKDEGDRENAVVRKLTVERDARESGALSRSPLNQVGDSEGRLEEQ